MSCNGICYSMAMWRQHTLYSQNAYPFEFPVLLSITRLNAASLPYGASSLLTLSASQSHGSPPTTTLSGPSATDVRTAPSREASTLGSGSVGPSRAAAAES